MKNLYDFYICEKRDRGFPFGVHTSRFLETVNKVKRHPPLEMQTGPAKRGDKKTMDAHKKMLKGNKEYLDIYKLLSKSIIQSSKKSKK